MIWLRVVVTAGMLSLFALPAAYAMGYDSLACPELGERRVAFFVEYGFCDPAKADQKDCKPIAGGSEAELPAAARTQVQMIVRTETRKSCPSSK